MKTLHIHRTSSTLNSGMMWVGHITAPSRELSDNAKWTITFDNLITERGIFAKDSKDSIRWFEEVVINIYSITELR